MTVDGIDERRRRRAARSALQSAVGAARDARRSGAVEAGDAEYLVREVQQGLMDLAEGPARGGRALRRGGTGVTLPKG